MEKYLPKLKKSIFFKEMDDGEILSVLKCVNAKVVVKDKNEYIFRVGETTSSMGLLLSGSVLILQDDLWGHRNIMTKIESGNFFAEPFAALPDARLNIDVVTTEKSEILFIDVGRMLTVCPGACAHHNRLVQNLVAVLSGKVLLFNDKITHMSKRTTRDKLLSYLSAESMRQGSLTFDIPFNRQQLADYLCVERAAMSVELSKLRKEGLLKTERNHFQLFREPDQ